MWVLRRFVAVCFLLVSATAAPGETPRPESMADTLRIMAGGLTGHGDIRVDEAAGFVEVTLPGGQIKWANPNNLHLQLQHAESAAERDAILDNFVRVVFSEHMATRDNIMLLVRHRDYAAHGPATWPMRSL